MVVRNASGSAVGFYVYHLSGDRMAEVLQVGAKPGFAKDVVDHLLSHAAAQGAVAVAGRLDPRYVEELGSGCTMRARYWMLVHSRNPQLHSALESGPPCLTRLEGEWCLQFHVARYRERKAPAAAAVSTLPAPVSLGACVRAESGGVEIIEALAEEWRVLCEEGHCREPFCRPEWVAAYVRAFAPHEKVVVLTARVGGVLRAVLPMIEERTHYCGIPVTKLHGAANAHACRFDLVRSAGAEGDAATAALWSYLKELPGWDLIEFPYVAEGAALEALAEAARRDGFPVGQKESMRSPYLPLAWLASGDDPILYQATPRFRALVRRKRRQIEASGQLVLRRITEADADALRVFYDLERSGWKGKEGTAIACQEDTQKFYDEIAHHGARYGYLTLFLLEFNGHAIAAQFGITHGGRYFMPKFAFDENYRQYGPGHLLIHEILRDCVQRGISEYDFTGPGAEYKAKWTSSTRLHSTVTIFRHGFFGEALHTAKFKVEAGVRDALRPLSRGLKFNVPH
jgi:CelD/BcsL family acetyltransferase involved in cellulose biosynthesis